MKLQRIELSHFVSIESAPGSRRFVSDIPSDIAVFVGKNGAGKSILLECIAYGSTLANSPAFGELCNSEQKYGSQFDPTEIKLQFDHGSWSSKAVQGTGGLKSSHTSTGSIQGVALYIPASRDIDKVNHSHIENRQFPTNQRVSTFDRELCRTFELTLASMSNKEIQANHHGMGQVPESVGLNRIRSAFGILFPDIRLVGTFGVEFLAEKNGRRFSIKHLSHGEKQALILFTFLAKEPSLQNSIILIDEPELGLSRPMKEKLVEAIRSLESTTQVLLSSHSEEIIQSVSPEKVIALTP